MTLLYAYAWMQLTYHITKNKIHIINANDVINYYANMQKNPKIKFQGEWYIYSQAGAQYLGTALEIYI
jgi:hypothetical protein